MTILIQITLYFKIRVIWINISRFTLGTNLLLGDQSLLAVWMVGLNPQLSVTKPSPLTAQTQIIIILEFAGLYSSCCIL